jgi:hypothetical protein
MKRVNKGWVSCLSTLFLLTFFHLNPAWAEVMHMQFDGGRLSANLHRAPLKLVLDKINKEKGILFTASSSLLDDSVSVQFANLSLEEALKRILSRSNYSLVFDKNEELIGATIIEKERTTPRVATAWHERPDEGIPFEEHDEFVDYEESFDDSGQDCPPGVPLDTLEEDIEGPGAVHVVETRNGLSILTEDDERLEILEGLPPELLAELAEQGMVASAHLHIDSPGGS